MFLTDHEAYVFFQLGKLWGSYNKAKYILEFPLKRWCIRAYRNPPEPLLMEELEDLLDDASEFYHRADIQNEEVNAEAQQLVAYVMEAINARV